MRSGAAVAVVGAYGHTGRFIVAELFGRGWTPIACGRNPAGLGALGAAHPGIDARVVRMDDPASLDRALAGASAVINAAGPFAATSAPVIEAAIRARIPCVDVAAEVEVVADSFARFSAPARAAGVGVVPAMGFYGALGDLLATAALGDQARADEISLAYALDSWRPTPGTRATIQANAERRGGRRAVFSAAGGVELRSDPAPVAEWTFPAPLGAQPVMAEFTTADSVTMARHLGAPEVRTYMTLAPLRDLSDPTVPPPVPADSSGRSAQTFLVEVVVRAGRRERRAVARGRDIYAVSAPLVAEAIGRLGGAPARVGVLAPGEAFDARDLLSSLARAGLSVELS